MTKAELYKRRNKNKQRTSSAEPPAVEVDDPNAELLNSIKSRTEKNSIENDVELIKANTIDTPVEETKPQFEETEDIPPVKPVEKTYAKSRSKLDDYIYIESSKGLDETEVAFPKSSRAKKSKESPSPVPRKRRKVENKDAKVNGESTRALRSNDKKTAKSPKAKEDKARATKESIENEKTAVTRVTRKRKYEDIESSKPVLREKGQNRASKTSVEKEATRKIARRKNAPKLAPLTLDVTQNVRMTRSRMRRLEVSLSPSQVKTIVPAFSFESDRRVNSVESASAKTNAKGKRKAKAKTPRATRARGNRR